MSGAASDQLVGRAVSGLPINSVKFAELAPHFGKDDMKILECIGWNKIFSNYDSYPIGFKNIIPYLVASIIFHQKFLKERLHFKHPLFSCSIFNRTHEIDGIKITIAEKFKGKILTGINFCNDTGMTASGIPPHVLHAFGLNELKYHINYLKEINESHFGKTSNYFNNLLSRISNDVANIIKSNFIIVGYYSIKSLL